MSSHSIDKPQPTATRALIFARRGESQGRHSTSLGYRRLKERLAKPKQTYDSSVATTIMYGHALASSNTFTFIPLNDPTAPEATTLDGEPLTSTPSEDSYGDATPSDSLPSISKDTNFRRYNEAAHMGSRLSRQLLGVTRLIKPNLFSSSILPLTLPQTAVKSNENMNIKPHSLESKLTPTPESLTSPALQLNNPTPLARVIQVASQDTPHAYLGQRTNDHQRQSILTRMANQFALASSSSVITPRHSSIIDSVGMDNDFSSFNAGKDVVTTPQRSFDVGWNHLNQCQNGSLLRRPVMMAHTSGDGNEGHREGRGRSKGKGSVARVTFKTEGNVNDDGSIDAANHNNTKLNRVDASRQIRSGDDHALDGDNDGDVCKKKGMKEGTSESLKQGDKAEIDNVRVRRSSTKQRTVKDRHRLITRDRSPLTKLPRFTTGVHDYIQSSWVRQELGGVIKSLQDEAKGLVDGYLGEAREIEYGSSERKDQAAKLRSLSDFFVKLGGIVDNAVQDHHYEYVKDDNKEIQSTVDELIERAGNVLTQQQKTLEALEQSYERDQERAEKARVRLSELKEELRVLARGLLIGPLGKISNIASTSSTLADPSRPTSSPSTASGNNESVNHIDEVAPSPLNSFITASLELSPPNAHVMAQGAPSTTLLTALSRMPVSTLTRTAEMAHLLPPRRPLSLSQQSIDQIVARATLESAVLPLSLLALHSDSPTKGPTADPSSISPSSTTHSAPTSSSFFASSSPSSSSSTTSLDRVIAHSQTSSSSKSHSMPHVLVYRPNSNRSTASMPRHHATPSSIRSLPLDDTNSSSSGSGGQSVNNTTTLTTQDTNALSESSIQVPRPDGGIDAISVNTTTHSNYVTQGNHGVLASTSNLQSSSLTSNLSQNIPSSISSMDLVQEHRRRYIIDADLKATIHRIPLPLNPDDESLYYPKRLGNPKKLKGRGKSKTGSQHTSSSTTSLSSISTATPPLTYTTNAFGLAWHPNERAEIGSTRQLDKVWKGERLVWGNMVPYLYHEGKVYDSRHLNTEHKDTRVEEQAKEKKEGFGGSVKNEGTASITVVGQFGTLSSEKIELEPLSARLKGRLEQMQSKGMATAPDRGGSNKMTIEWKNEKEGSHILPRIINLVSRPALIDTLFTLLDQSPSSVLITPDHSFVYRQLSSRAKETVSVALSMDEQKCGKRKVQNNGGGGGGGRAEMNGSLKGKVAKLKEEESKRHVAVITSSDILDDSMITPSDIVKLEERYKQMTKTQEAILHATLQTLSKILQPWLAPSVSMYSGIMSKALLEEGLGRSDTPTSMNGTMGRMSTGTSNTYTTRQPGTSHLFTSKVTEADVCRWLIASICVHSGDYEALDRLGSRDIRGNTGTKPDMTSQSGPSIDIESVTDLVPRCVRTRLVMAPSALQSLMLSVPPLSEVSFVGLLTTAYIQLCRFYLDYTTYKSNVSKQ